MSDEERAERCETHRFECCKTCRFYHGIKGFHYCSDRWICRRFPATVDKEELDWCGEWQLIGPPTAERKCPQLLDIYETRERLCVTSTAVRKWAKSGELPSIGMPNGEFCFIESDLTEWVEQHRHPKQ